MALASHRESTHVIVSNNVEDHLRLGARAEEEIHIAQRSASCWLLRLGMQALVSDACLPFSSRLALMPLAPKRWHVAIGAITSTSIA
jgi:hypothetical protein